MGKSPKYTGPVGRDVAVGAVVAFGTWLLLPDILSKAETACLIATIAWITACAVSDVRYRLAVLKAERERLTIRRKPSNRDSKVIDFAPRRRKHLWFVSTNGEKERLVMM